jgi:hypothetical protein
MDTSKAYLIHHITRAAEEIETAVKMARFNARMYPDSQHDWDQRRLRLALAAHADLCRRYDAIMAGEPTGTPRYLVATASEKMPSSCWGSYGRVAVVEVADGVDTIAMISPRARGVIRIVEQWRRCNKGTSDRCAYARAVAEAEEHCAELNSAAELNSEAA